MIDGAVSGLVTGSAYAILAVCVVLLYRLVGVLNFSLAALGALGAYACYAIVGAGAPLAVAVFAGLAASGLVAACAGWVLARWFGDPTPTVQAVVSVVMLIVLLSVGFAVFGDTPRVMPSLLPEASFAVGGVRVSLTTVTALVLTAVISLALTILLRVTRIGIRLQAMSERPMTLQLLGVNTRRLTVGAWAVAGALAAAALLLIAPTHNPTFASMAFLIVPALAAGLIGAFSNVWIAAAGGLLIGIAEGVGARITGLSDYRGAVPFVVIVLALIWMRRREVWDEAR